MIPGILYSEIQHYLVEDSATRRWFFSKELMDWLDENNINVEEKEFIIDRSPGRQFGWLFESDEDMMAFKLRWI